MCGRCGSMEPLRPAAPWRTDPDALPLCACGARAWLDAESLHRHEAKRPARRYSAIIGRALAWVHLGVTAMVAALKVAPEFLLHHGGLRDGMGAAFAASVAVALCVTCVIALWHVADLSQRWGALARIAVVAASIPIWFALVG